MWSGPDPEIVSGRAGLMFMEQLTTFASERHLQELLDLSRVATDARSRAQIECLWCRDSLCETLLHWRVRQTRLPQIMSFGKYSIGSGNRTPACRSQESNQTYHAISELSPKSSTSTALGNSADRSLP